MKTFVKAFGMNFSYGSRPHTTPDIEIVKNDILKRLLDQFKPLMTGNKPYKNNNRIVVIQQMLVDWNNKGVVLTLDYTKLLNSQILLHKISNQDDGLLEDEAFEEDTLENDDTTHETIYTGGKDYGVFFYVSGVEFDEGTNNCKVELKTYVTVKGNNNPLLILLSKLESSLSEFQISDVDISPQIKEFATINNELSQIKIKKIWQSHDSKNSSSHFETVTTVKLDKGYFSGEKVKEIYNNLMGYEKTLGFGEGEIMYIKGLDKLRQNLQFMPETGDDDLASDDGSMKMAIIYKKQLPDGDDNVFNKFVNLLQDELQKEFSFSIPPVTDVKNT